MRRYSKHALDYLIYPRAIIQEARLRKTVNKVAVEQLIAEEKIRLKKEQENAQGE
jgi:hypothetical protein